MLCEHLEGLYRYIRENRIEISALELIHVVCHQCKVEDKCPYIPVDRYEEYQEWKRQREQEKEGR